MMAGQARQIALRKLEVAVLSHGAFQAQRNGFCALLSDVFAFIDIRTADHKWTMLTKFNVVAYGDCDVWSK